MILVVCDVSRWRAYIVMIIDQEMLDIYIRILWMGVNFGAKIITPIHCYIGE